MATTILKDSISLDPNGINLIPLDSINPSPYQIRDDYGDIVELANSIREHGQLVPIKVWVEQESDSYFRIYAHDGHRRLKAFKYLLESDGDPEFSLVKAVVCDPPKSEADALAEQFIYNNSGLQLSLPEQLKIVQRLQSLGLTQVQIAQKLGKSQPWISNLIKLTQLDNDIFDLVQSGKLSYRAAMNLSKTQSSKSTTKKTKKQQNQNLDDLIIELIDSSVVVDRKDDNLILSVPLVTWNKIEDLML